jgi:cytochrome c5
LSWTAITLGSAVAAFSAGQQEMAPGEILMNTACMECHEYRTIQTQAHDQEGWTKIVKTMMGKGAKIKDNDVPVLTEYLSLHHGPLPDGAGKAIVLEVCTMCHERSRVTDHGATREEWNDILEHMIGEGAPLSDDDFPVLLNYLTRNFRPH